MNYYDDNEIDNYELINEQIKKQIENKKLIKVNLNEINIDDIVYVTFYPCSQKYIYYLTPKYGKVTKINNIKTRNYNNEDEFITDITINNLNNVEENMMHPGVSFMGHSSGYDYSIYLVE
jgi:hypothetical protein